jgi:hypothetical protein
MGGPDRTARWLRLAMIVRCSKPGEQAEQAEYSTTTDSREQGARPATVHS